MAIPTLGIALLNKIKQRLHVLQVRPRTGGIFLKIIED
jgi:hypothetical protein